MVPFHGFEFELTSYVCVTGTKPVLTLISIKKGVEL